MVVLPRKRASAQVQEKVTAALKAARIEDRLPKTLQITAYVEDPIPKGATIEEAHANWTAEGLWKTRAVRGLPKRDAALICPDGLIRVAVECANPTKISGMGLYYGFEGYFASLLISLESGLIWDARGEPAVPYS